MSDFCPPVVEWHYYVNPEPYMAYVRFAVGLLCGVLISIAALILAPPRIGP